MTTVLNFLTDVLDYVCHKLGNIRDVVFGFNDEEASGEYSSGAASYNLPEPTRVEIVPPMNYTYRV